MIVSKIYSNVAQMQMQALAKLLNVDELHFIDENGMKTSRPLRCGLQSDRGERNIR